MKIIVALDEKYGFARLGKIPWDVSEDRAHFQRETTRMGVVLMGRKTWESLPPQRRPLARRENIVISTTMEEEKGVRVYKTPEEFLEARVDLKNVALIGGCLLMSWFLERGWVKEIIITRIPGNYHCDQMWGGGYYAIETGLCNLVSKVGMIETWRPRNFDEEEYLHVMKNILDTEPRPDRTGVGTRALPGIKFSFNLEDGRIPILTTKRVYPWVGIEEMLFFLHGSTNTKELEDKKVVIWRKNTSRAFMDAIGLNYPEGEMGPMYGHQFRNFNHQVDQLARVEKLLQTDPFSRRIIMTSFNPAEADLGVLYPCHGISIQFFCTQKDDQLQLTCCMTQRSMDLFLGAPYNFLGYALLTHILAKRAGMAAKELIILGNDVHIYNNHVDACTEQLKRIPMSFPRLGLKEEVVFKNWEDITNNDCIIYDYEHEEAIRGRLN